jgi:hypothetical protein
MSLIFRQIESKMSKFIEVHDRTPTRLTLGVEAHYRLFQACAMKVNPEIWVKDRKFKGMQIFINPLVEDDFIGIEG